MAKTSFKDTIWIVPYSTLTAYFTVNDKHQKVVDQTVWIVDDHHIRYWMGNPPPNEPL
jgi:hypothetical protein